MPLTPLCKMYDAETRSHYATNYLLPQKLMSSEANDDDADTYLGKDKGRQPFIKFSANVNSTERNSGFTRVPTPYPRRPKKSSRSPKEETESRILMKSKENENVPQPSSNTIRTALVRRPAVSSEGEEDSFGYSLRDTSKEITELLSPKGNKQHKLVTRSVNDLLLTDLFRPISNTEASCSAESADESTIANLKINESNIVEDGYESSRTPSLKNELQVLESCKTVVEDLSDCNNSIANSIDCEDVTDYCKYEPQSVIPKPVSCLNSVGIKEASVGATTKCTSELDNGKDGKFWASVAMCTNQNQSIDSNLTWTFGVHRNATVIEVVVEKVSHGIGFTLSVNEDGSVVVDSINKSLISSPDLRFGDKILQIESVDVLNFDLEYINSILNSCPKSFSIMISRLL